MINLQRWVCIGYFLLTVTSFVASGFCPAPLLALRRALAAKEEQERPIFRPSTLKLTSSDYSESEVEDMEELIVSISKETTDQTRRDRLAAVFQDAFNASSGSNRFSDLFNEILMVVGDRVKLKAEQKALQQQQQKASDSEDQSTAKTPEEKQLWALVDMMVQSKMIVKRAKQAGA